MILGQDGHLIPFENKLKNNFSILMARTYRELD